MPRNRTQYEPIGQVTRLGGIKFEEIEQIDQNQLSGLDTIEDPRDLDRSQLTLARNLSVQTGKWTRRPGSELITPVKPNADKILLFDAIKRNDQSVILLRFTHNKVYRRGLGAWTEITSAAPITGSDNDRIQLAGVNDNFFFANNGVDAIQSINIGANTYAALGNAPKYKYICYCNNRVIGAYDLNAQLPLQIGGSGDLNFAEWDPLVDPSAFKNTLIDAPGNYPDSIAGVDSFGDGLIIMRERSIWFGSKQPNATQPFYFFPKVTNVGSDVPNSIAITRNGLCFADTRTNLIYYYQVGNDSPDEIGLPIQPEMNLSRIDPNTIYSGYDPYNSEYIIGLPQPGSNTVIQWIYSFITKTWYEEEFTSSSSISNVPFSTSSNAIDDLIGDIDSLVGSINDLSPAVNFPTRFIGRIDGDILQTSESSDADNNSSYTFEIASKTFEESKDFYVRRLLLGIEVIVGGTISIYYSKNSVDWVLYKDIDLSPLDAGKRILVKCSKLIKCRQYKFRVTSTSGRFSITEYKIERDAGGPSRK